MARGDITILMHANSTTSDAKDRQPAGSVKEMLLNIGSFDQTGTTPDKIPSFSMFQIDGTNNDTEMIFGGSGESTMWVRVKPIASNTHYFRGLPTGGTGDRLFTVIEVE